ncbi:MAG: chorismate-binding protein [Ignavibacteriales bacterium]|nr:MAG: chorismate-binding protein [Ignavibacteriales bacterium]
MDKRTEISSLLNRVLRGRGNALFLTPPGYQEGKSLLLSSPVYVKAVRGLKDIREIERRRTENPENFGALLLDYEFGFRLEEKISRLSFTDSDITGVYYEYQPEKSEVIDPATITLYPKKRKQYRVFNQVLSDSPDSYGEKVERLKEYIARGDTYQINLTTEAYFTLDGDLTAFIIDLLKKQSAQYITIINTGAHLTISVSPELFFRVRGDKILTAPMKGTIKRGKNLQEDEIRKEQLGNSAKDRAENLMIVDLLRNDLGKICEFGSVNADRLFEIETYETVHQMVSYISGKLRAGTGLSDIITALFPCGSITGAPKFRSMEIINELERRKRGLYTGSIFFFTPEETTANVAIRTAELFADSDTPKRYRGVLPLGSGVVWDSTPDGEYAEILKKGEFLTRRHNDFRLFETCYFDGEKIPLLDLHLNRLKGSAKFHLFLFDEAAIKEALRENFTPGQELIMKLLLGKWGELEVQTRPYEKIYRHLRVLLSDNGVNSESQEFYFKTTLRDFYDEEFSCALHAGYDEVLFLNEHGRITEGSWTNFFYELGGQLYTPEVSEGLLDGVLRQKLLAEGTLRERNISPEDLAQCARVFMGNSVRGLMPVAEVRSGKNRLFYNKN